MKTSRVAYPGFPTGAIFFAENCKKMKTNALQSESLALPTGCVRAKTALIENPDW